MDPHLIHELIFVSYLIHKLLKFVNFTHQFKRSQLRITEMTLVLTKRMVKSEKHAHPQPKPLESIDTYI